MVCQRWAFIPFRWITVRKGREGTDFTIQIVITHIGSLLVATASGKLANERL